MFKYLNQFLQTWLTFILNILQVILFKFVIQNRYLDILILWMTTTITTTILIFFHFNDAGRLSLTAIAFFLLIIQWVKSAIIVFTSCWSHIWTIFPPRYFSIIFTLILDYGSLINNILLQTISLQAEIPRLIQLQMLLTAGLGILRPMPRRFSPPWLLLISFEIH